MRATRSGRDIVVTSGFKAKRYILVHPGLHQPAYGYVILNTDPVQFTTKCFDISFDRLTSLWNGRPRSCRVKKTRFPGPTLHLVLYGQIANAVAVPRVKTDRKTDYSPTEVAEKGAVSRRPRGVILQPRMSYPARNGGCGTRAKRRLQ